MQRVATYTTTRRLHTLAGASFLLVGLAIANYPAHAQALDASGTRAVATYESVGLYWANPGANSTTGCEVKFRRAGDAAWTQGLAMWFDARNSECRGSLVGLTPATNYEAQFNLPGLPATKGLTFSTWANQLPVAKTITVASGAATYNITEGGSASGYVVYQGASGATLDALNASAYNVTINASYVILRGLTLKGAQQDAIRISPNVKDVVIEDNDISGWGRTRDGKWGTDMDSGVRAVCSTETLERVTIQRNKIHDPRYSANSWSDGHPAGPQAVTISYCGGNHVIRWNEMYSTNGNYFNDVIGGEDNFTKTGFPNADTDIYGNKISNSWDDGIEAEGGNKNVRIWGNYLDRTATGIATTVASMGPVYIFRNVFNRNQFFQNKTHDTDDRQPFFKSGSDASLGDGRRYIFHNTMLQATEAGSSYGLGGGAGIGGTGSSQLINNTVSMNNIYHLWKPNSAFYQVGAGNAFQNDMFNGSAGAPMVSGINATPTYAAGNGWQSESSGQYQLAAGTPGSQQAARIANFNDVFSGAAPDVGAYEPALGTMKFGLAAAGATPPPPPPPPPPTPGPGTATTSLLSSSNPSTYGQAVTFTASIIGSAASPTGTVNFKDGTRSVAGCSTVAVSAGKATCVVSSLALGAHSITAAYSGDATYPANTSSAIAQTVNSGTTPPPVASASLGVDSSSYTIAAGQSVTFTVTLSGSNGVPTGTMNFQDNGVSIAGCSSVAIASGKATCTTSALTAGSHPIKALYSGSSSYTTGVAGPITQTVTGAAALTATIDSSSYTAPAGIRVTFTVRVSGNVGAPTGTINFMDGSTSIAGCSAVAVNSSGTAKCTTRTLAAGNHSIKGMYAGNYGSGVAGPITQTIN
jgi:Big-like domain-containing protein